MFSLYDLAVLTVAENLHSNPSCRLYEILPVYRQIDVLQKVEEIGHLTVLDVELKKRNIFKLFLRIARLPLHSIFQCLMNCGDGDIADFYVDLIESETTDLLEGQCPVAEETIQFALVYGDFLAEAGWYKHAEKVYTAALKCIQRNSDEQSIIRALDCCTRLLRVQNGYCCFTEAVAMVECTMDMLDELSESAKAQYNKAYIYTEMAVLFFAKSHYVEAFHHSFYALQELSKSNVDVSTTIDVLRLCSKSLVAKRELKLAGRFIVQAMKLAHTHHGEKHPKYTDTMMDYGYYLLNVDHVASAVHIYSMALNLRKQIFGGGNLHLALSHEDLAYAYYVYEYNNGNFDRAKENSQKAISILSKILPVDHLLLASSKRVKALILEEMAIDIEESIEESQRLLKEALSLHEEALALAKKTFGEHNVQTAKHYGNLGRLYQTLHQWATAEEMHKKAIKTKEEILGEEDYEVALSVGHLASLYNYDMNQLCEAEELYKRSIAITIKLFGKGYSGLQYDYQGLIHLYRETSQFDKMMQYSHELLEWHEVRTQEHCVESTTEPLNFLTSNSETSCYLSDNIQYLIEECSKLVTKPTESYLLNRSRDSLTGLNCLEISNKMST